MVKRTVWRILFVAAVAALFGSQPALAQTKIKFGYTCCTGLVAGMVAIDKGFFKQNGIEAEATQLKNGGVVAPGLIANEIQLGTLTPSVVIQAYDGGLHLKFFVAATNLTPQSKEIALVARNNVKLEKPQDYLGKSFAVGSLNSSGYLFLRQIIRNMGVDPNGSKFVEVGLTQMPDVVRSGGVDAGVMFAPTIAGAVATNQMYVAEYVGKLLPANLADAGYAVSEDWANKNPQALPGIKKALEQATEWARNNQDEAREIAAKYLGIKKETLATNDFPTLTTKLDESDMKWWIDVMRAEKMLRTDVQPKDVLVQLPK